jgi:hypothetical protein
MTDEKRTKYIICFIHEVNDFYKKGYEISHIFEEIFTSTEFFNGTFMGNSISMNLPKYNKISKALMELNPSAETLYGEKR